jgi:glucose dehydrogenase
LAAVSLHPKRHPEVLSSYLRVSAWLCGAARSCRLRTRQGRQQRRPGDRWTPAFSAAELSAFASDNWLTTGRGLSDNRYSTLTQINAANVANLHVAWQIHLRLSAKEAKALNEEGAATAYNGILYIPDGKSDV